MSLNSFHLQRVQKRKGNQKEIQRLINQRWQYHHTGKKILREMIEDQASVEVRKYADIQYALCISLDLVVHIHTLYTN